MIEMLFKSVSLPLSKFITNSLMQSKTEQSVLLSFEKC